jgi:putative transposase
MARLKRENTRLEEEVAFLKKGGSVLCQTTQVKYAMIKTNETHYSVDMMCRLMAVSRSGYYDWRHRPISDRSQADQVLAIEVKRVFDDEKSRPDSPPITRRLQEEGRLVGRHRVARIMRATGWRAKAAKTYKAPRTATIPYPLPLIYQSKIAQRMPPIKSGYLI